MMSGGLSRAFRWFKVRILIYAALLEDISILEFPVSGVRCPESDIFGKLGFFFRR
jgi:hypothetical protein